MKIEIKDGTVINLNEIESFYKQVWSLGGITIKTSSDQIYEISYETKEERDRVYEWLCLELDVKRYSEG